MSEIKLRIYDKEYEKMSFLDDEDYEYIYPNVFRMDLKNEIEEEYFWNDITDNCVIMQYTGLKDKNGKEIYEGDIVKVENIDLAQIIYDEDRMAWGIKPIDEFYFDSPFLADNISLELEVIGNIYDNPDLIKE